MLFPKLEENAYSRFLSIGQVEMFLMEKDHVYLMFPFLRVESSVKAINMSMVCKFPDVFLEDISDLTLERGVEFAIDFVPGTSPISMAPYQMSAVELTELKKKLEDLFERKFNQASDSLWGALVFLVNKKDGSMHLYV